MRDQVQLIAYADRLGGTLSGLGRLLDGPLAGLFGGVHVLQFFVPYDGVDAGFDPVDHLRVDPRLGGWDDLRRLGGDRDTVVDLIVNHMSAGAARFRDVVERGAESRYAGMFLTYGSVFPAGASERTRGPCPGRSARDGQADLLRAGRPAGLRLRAGSAVPGRTVPWCGTVRP